jgi:hypothetical protein
MSLQTQPTPTPTPRILVFYHIYCMKLTEEIVKDQITKILFSGLYDTVDAIYCFITGQAEIIKNIINILQNHGKKFIIEQIGIDDTSFERFTIHKIKNYIQPEDKFLYFHNKGVLRNNEECIKDWKTFMEYYLMRHHAACLKLLDTYDTVGVDYRVAPFLHYHGNFWWCRGSYFLGLPDISTLTVAPSRYSYTENYLGLNKPNAYCFLSADCDHYTCRYYPAQYVDTPVICPTPLLCQDPPLL